MRRLSLITALALLIAPDRARAQEAPPTRAWGLEFVRIRTIGSDLDDRERVAQLLDSTKLGSRLLRTASMMTPGAPRDGYVHLRLVQPELMYTWNSDLPWSPNDGALWAGRGLNRRIRYGLLVDAGPFRLFAAPESIVEENRAFQVIPYPDLATRSPWANPFHPPLESIDLPLRFGAKSRGIVDPGQSGLTWDFGPATLGYSTENIWWGPGIFNALILSNNAAGFAHTFVRTSHPLVTRAGVFEGQWLIGRLDESDFFLTDTTPRSRSLAGIHINWKPSPTSGLSLGFNRVVMSAEPRGRLQLSAAMNAFRLVGRPNTAPADPAHRPASDQMFSVVGRYVAPKSGFETYFEWARMEEPSSLADLLEFPQHSQAYTLGLQWARPVYTDGTLRTQVEASYLEPSAALRVQPEFVSYTSAAVPAGFTHRGQTLGATIGPGSSSQFIATDVLFPRWRIGGSFTRIRNDNGPIYTALVPFVKLQDVTMMGSLRGSVIVRGIRVEASYTKAVRLNYLYQSYDVDAATGKGKRAGIDLPNRTLTLTISPAGGF